MKTKRNIKFGFCKFKFNCRNQHCNDKCEDFAECKSIKNALKGTHKSIGGLLQRGGASFKILTVLITTLSNTIH